MSQLKVALVGPSNSGKTSLIRFLKNLSDDESYEETWGMHLHMIEWESRRLGVWETGGNFLKKHSYYHEQLLGGAQVVVYVIALGGEGQDESLLSRID